MGLGKISTKMCAQLHVFSLWRLTWVFEGTWKKFSQKSVPSHMFLRCGDYLKLWIGLEKSFDKKVWPDSLFFAVETNLSFWWDLESFDKKVWPVTRFFAVETNLNFWWDLENLSQKSVPSHTFLHCGEYLKFLRGLGKFREKGVTSYTFFFAVQTILSFG